MNFSTIICTYQRPNAILKLLDSIQKQTHYPNEIIIIDGSVDRKTEFVVKDNEFNNVYYFKVTEVDRGLTKQRNFGISKISQSTQIVFFLDDDVVLKSNYFEEILKTYKKYPRAVGIGGIITNEIQWKHSYSNITIREFAIDGWVRKEGSRFLIRKKLNLIDETPPGYMPIYSHGRSIGFLPPSGKIYEVEFFMGGVSSFKMDILNQLRFSTYFEGYGLYEDMDFCLRVSKIGQLYVNTAAQLEHHHEISGRPNFFKYGKMAVRNGWYVWRVKYFKPTFKAKVLFHLNVLLLMKIRLLNSLYGHNKRNAFLDGFGRFVGWISLFFNKPNI